MGVGNYDPSAYIKPGVTSYFLADQKLFVSNGVPYVVQAVGSACAGTSPCLVLLGNRVFIGSFLCGREVMSKAKHLEGIDMVDDYSTVMVIPEGMIFIVKPGWLGHFLSKAEFVAFPPQAVV